MTSVGDLVVNFSGNTRGLRNATTEGRGLVSRFSSSATNMLGKIGLAAQGVKVIAGSVKSLLGTPIKLASEYEQAEVAFTTMLGSAERAKKVLGDLAKFSASTPFQLPELRDASRLLLANNLPAEELIGTMKTLGDISSGSGGKLIELTRIFNKMRATGRVSLENINELMLRNIPVWDLLVKQTGKTKEEIRQLASTGKLSFGDMAKLLNGLTAEGGMFHDSMGKQSKTLAGVWSTMKDNFSLVMAEIGKLFIEAFDLKGIVGNTTEFIQYFRTQWMPAIKATIMVVADAFKLIGFAVRNFIPLMEIVWVHIKTFGSNTVQLFTNIATQGISIWLDYAKGMAQVWKNLFKTLLDNATEFGKAIINAIQGKGFNFEFQTGNLLKGAEQHFHRAGRQLFAGMKDAKPEVDRLFDKIARDEAARRKSIAAKAGTKGGINAGPSTLGGGSSSGTIEGSLRNSSSFFQRLADIRRGTRENKQVEEQKKANNILSRIEQNTAPDRVPTVQEFATS